MKRTLFFSALLLTFSILAARALTPVTYRGVLAQEGENAPYEAYVFENGLNTTFTFQRVDAGQYHMDASANVFPASGKVFIQTSLYNEGMDVTNLCLVKGRRWDGNTLLFSTFKYDPVYGWLASDDCSFFLELLVYP